MKRALLSVVVVSLGLSAGGCKESPPPAPPPEAKPTPPPEPPPAPPEPEPVAEKECAAALTATPPEELTIAGRKATRTGYKLSFADAAADGSLRLGVLGPVNEDSGLNLLTMKKYLKFFDDQKVAAIVLTGDIAETAPGIERVLDAVAASKKPVLVVAGNRECRADYAAAVEAAQKRYDGLVNLNQLRSVDFPEATLVSLPGYHDSEFMGCETGCLYFPSTLKDVAQLAKEAKSPVVLVSHGPPKGDGSQAIDFAASGGNVGDPALRKLIEEAAIPFGLFSNIKEAGGRATDSAAGTTLVKEGTFSNTLFLNPGAADTSPWDMNGGGKSVGAAAVVTIKSGQASWKAFKAKAPTNAEKKAAAALAPPKPAATPEAPATGSAVEPAVPTPPPGQPVSPK